MVDLEALEAEARMSLAEAGDETALDEWRVAWLGRRGRLTAVLRGVRDLPAEERPRVGAGANRLKSALEDAVAAHRAKLHASAEDAESIDVSLPGRTPPLGSLHPVTLTRRHLERTFRDMGFDVVEGPDVELEEYNFDRLRIPAGHPARDMWDTIWVADDAGDNGGPRQLLRTHTSPMQIRYLEQRQPPIRVIVPGTCYRYEATDATHEWMLTQIEGLVIDENLSFAHLKGTLEAFVRRMFGADIETRFRCDYFPFVEPGAELGVRWQGDWLEVLGCGMVHPEIIEDAGLDPDRYTGFAFGMGVERVAMLRYGVRDIRHFYRNDVRFLRQFEGRR
ncbi:MAG: phenylalanine--tRNA ligase subunit alpha [Chloroflexi bacterium]|nr:phenylalanine--tRNA ligase subunit alpha [Chloroflexota bacterium]MCY3697725.1 phenylalanine--tRNA ligase subunit alpha [Chloroflexota bacterium]MXX32926.1 phenylalanine--tRNA ligase subunit alpha [Chloroflexota bacterium]MYD17572.1 phenylalanine--tRNA ligase subunit alpha [Chloroflexota bacterium]MYJ01362.1 phenylalanine--tRNA ligase subunit alpha [Chloroflexota bacterium]